MGVNLSCLKRSNTALGESIVDTDEMRKSRLQQSRRLQKELDEESIDIVIKADSEDIQKAAIGYLVRKAFRPEFREARLEEFMSYASQFNFQEEIDIQPIWHDSQTLYSGDLNKWGRKSGEGIEIVPNKHMYIGGFHNNEFDGQGRLVHITGNTYNGLFKEGKANGKGVFLHSNGSICKGSFANDLLEGKGKEEFPDGSRFSGTYQDGSKNGFGIYEWADGRVYKGEFFNNAFHGRGILEWADGKCYNGEWTNGKMNGKGEFSWPDGRQYSGSYLNDLKHGFGKFSWPDNRYYEGEYKEGLQHGRGVFYYQKRGEFVLREGEWNKGKKIRWVNG